MPQESRAQETNKRLTAQTNVRTSPNSLPLWGKILSPSCRYISVAWRFNLGGLYKVQVPRIEIKEYTKRFHKVSEEPAVFIRTVLNKRSSSQRAIWPEKFESLITLHAVVLLRRRGKDKSSIPYQSIVYFHALLSRLA
ncbi:hypothetical protein AVEN_209828-1 [Araneus ventricosus]|uniref:Uncharacterized protein n=1 Tax=Araneus ventricosus TaxID=182803 RepID=A0A4Y2FZ42_ARAVE|nr:hypothetical protein AVEN_209828-1 [Araneus ventricosus]